MLLLLVDPDAPAVAARLAPLLDGHPDVSVTPALNAVAARAYLAGASFDAVAVARADEAALLRALVEALGQPAVVHVYAGEADLAAWLGRRLGVPVGRPPETVAPDTAREALVEVRNELARLVHALNNPLSVIAGNAQLGRELALATAADAEVVAALESIDEAATALGGLFSEVSALRVRLDRATG